jgi:hypothetical protein
LDPGVEVEVDPSDAAFGNLHDAGSEPRPHAMLRCRDRVDCTDPSGDPIVLYDQFVDRWILSQFTTSGLSDPNRPFWNCVAISTTGDPTGTYYRYAFETENFQFFPDYPKYGVWTDSYVITTREFGPTVEYGTAGWAASRRTSRATWPSATAWSTARQSSRESATRAG